MRGVGRGLKNSVGGFYLFVKLNTFFSIFQTNGHTFPV